MIQFIVLAFVGFFALGFVFSLFQPRAAGSFTGSAYVIDGDTLAFGDVRVRLFGIDAPEMRQSQGAQSKSEMLHLVRGKTLTIRPIETDPYDRIIAKVYLPDGTDLSARMVELGYARAYTHFSKAYLGAERAARRSLTGLWATGGMEDGADWRRTN